MRAYSTLPGFVLVAVSALSVRAGAEGETGFVVAGRVSQIAAVERLVAVVGSDEVRFLDAAGRTVSRLGLESTPASAARAPSDRARANATDRAFDLLGVPESERDTWAARDLLEEDARGAEARRLRMQRRSARARDLDEQQGPRPLAPRLAAAPDGIYAAAAGALWFVAAEGAIERRAALREAPDALAAASGGRVAFLSGGRVALSFDGGPCAIEVRGLPADMTQIALAPNGETLAWASGSLVGWRGREGAGSTPLPSPVRDLRFCGASLVALTAHEVVIVREDEDGDEDREAHRHEGGFPLSHPARRLACALDGAGPWLAVDPGAVIVGGSRPAASPGAVTSIRVLDAAVAGGDVWLATANGLLHASSDASSLSALSRGEPTVPDASDGTWVRALETRPPLWWGLLPRLALQASASGSPTRRDYRALLLADLPLGRRGPERPIAWAPRPPPHPVRVAALQAPTPSGGAAARGAAAGGLDERCLDRTRERAVELALVEPGRARSLVNRAANGAWLPELRLRVERRLGRSESLDLGPAPSGNAAPVGLDTANDIRYEARATWDLGRLVFDPEEIAASAQALRMADMRRDLESHIVRLFFERRRLDLETPPGPTEPAFASRRALRAEEIEAELDALSAGAFSKCWSRKTPP